MCAMGWSGGDRKVAAGAAWNWIPYWQEERMSRAGHRHLMRPASGRSATICALRKKGFWREMLTVNPQRLLGREMSVREKGLWARALKALDDARLSGDRFTLGGLDGNLSLKLAYGR